MTTLVTGGAGFIGSNLVHALLSNGESVRVLDDLSRPGVEKNVRWLEEIHGSRFDLVVADVRDPDAVYSAMRGVTHVFHLAAQVAVTTSITDPRYDYDVNATGTLNVLEAIRAAGSTASLIYTSTNKVYGALDDVALVLRRDRYEPVSSVVATRGISESRPLSFHSPYGCSKGTADQYVIDWAHTFGIRAAVFRMSCIYGPHQFGNEDQGWVAHFLSRALKHEPITIFGDGHQVRDVLFVDDLVDALLRARGAIDRISGRAFNVGGGPTSTLSLVELVDVIERQLRRRPNITFEPWRIADQRWYVSDTRALERTTSWRPQVDPNQGIARLIDWLAAEIEDRRKRPEPAVATL